MQTGAPREQAPAPVTGPSFLGLSEPAAKQDVGYLLEDEEPRRGHIRMFIALLLLVVALGFLFWRWRGLGYTGLDRLTQSTPVTSAPPASVNSGGPPVGAAAAKGQAPSEPLAPSTALGTQGPPPALPSSDEAHMTSTDESAPTQKPQAPVAKPPRTVPSAKHPAATSSNDEAQADDEPADTSAPKNEDRTSEAAPKQAPAPVTTNSDETAKPPKTNPADDRLVSEGEKYLYGTGAAQNCGRAEKSLRTAAGHSNPQAMSALGTMYATGHCVDRDLPNAYRWFARALHLDPGNGRVQRDLEVLWKQMSADERQLAVRNSQ